MSREDLTFAVVRKAKQAPKFLSVEVLRKLACPYDGTAGIAALRALAAMDKLDKPTKAMFDRWLNDEDKEVAEYRAEQAAADKKRLKYGVTWGPVGKDAVKIAIKELSRNQSGWSNTGDTKWETCIKVIRKARDPKAVPALLEYLLERGWEEPSDKPWDPSPLNKYPAITALLAMGDRFLPKVAEEIGSAVGWNMGPRYEQTLVNVLCARMGPGKCLRWLNEQIARKDASYRPQFERLKGILLKTKSIPKYVNNQRFSGPVRLKRP